MTKWDYKMPVGHTATSQTDWNQTISQIDWNQTIVTTFNRVSLGMVLPVKVSASNKFKPIFESLVFYNNKVIDNRFIIDFVDTDDDVIYVGNKQFEVINYSPTYKKPPIGLMPKDIYDRNAKVERFSQVCKAIQRYYNENLKIPVEWIEEYNELIDETKDMYEKET